MPHARARARERVKMASTVSTHVYEIRPRKDGRGFDLISDALPFGRLWSGEPDAIGNAIGYAKFYSRSHDAMIRVYDEAGTWSRRTSNRAISSTHCSTEVLASVVFIPVPR